MVSCPVHFALKLFMRYWVPAVAMWVMWMMNFVHMVDLPILCPIDMLLVVMVDKEIAALVNEVLVIMVYILLLVMIDHLLPQVTIVLTVEM